MSRGAINAGLRIKWGFDFNLSACQTYALNFIGTSIYNVWANDFSEAKGDHRVDICHLSPPCQYFSDAHTWEGKDDEMNTASLFAIFNLLEKAKPRVVTLEQTSGLIRRHPIFFNAVINMFTSRGFSVRWRVLNCADFGLPQRRMRLFVIASW
jgi:DNA (cytosine-5)-methyltransferase 1